MSEEDFFERLQQNPARWWWILGAVVRPLPDDRPDPKEAG